MVARARVIALLALAMLSAVTALSLGRVVDSSRFVLPVLGAALLPHVLGAVVRWRGWSIWIGWLLTAVGLVVYVVVALETSTTTFGLPGSATWHAVGTQLSGGWHLLRTAPAPAPTTDGAILLAVLGVWVMAALADWLAFGRHTALAAMSPALVFFVWTSTLGTDDWQFLLTAAFCVAAAAFVWAQNLALLDQRRSWLVSQRGSRPHWLAPAALLGGAAVVVALVVAPLVPGVSSNPLLDIGGAGRDNSAGRSYKPVLAPFVDIGQKLQDVNDRELFTVRSDTPDYWRIAALDTYSGTNGGSWTLSAEGNSVEVGLPSSAPAGALQQQFDIGPLGERWLPAAYDPVAISLPDTLQVRSSGTLVSDANEVTGLRYTVASRLPPLAGTTFSAEQIAATDAPVPRDLRKYTALPTTPDIRQITQKAKEVTAGASTPYDQAQRLRDWFRDPANGFVYDTEVGDSDGTSAILTFLENKHGYCVQFASAYAVMARSLGIPARVAVGFTPGKLVDGRYHVTSHDAHAWPEIYLAGMGWTHLFDPTPSSRDTPAGGSALPNDTATGATTATTAPPPTAATNPDSGAADTSPSAGAGTPSAAGTTPATPTVPPPPASSSSSGTGAWLPVLLVIGLAIVLLAGYVGAVLGLKRRRRARRRAADPTSSVQGAWAEALDRLHEADVVPRPAQTPLDLAATAPFGIGASTARPMHELARAYGAARYGEGVLEPDDANDAWESLDDLEQALDDGASWSRRWRRRLDASTLVRR